MKNKYLSHRSIRNAVLLCVLFWTPLLSQETLVTKFDPFLQRELKSSGNIALFRQAEPDIPSAALSKIRQKSEPLYNVIFHGTDATFDELSLHFNTILDGIATARVSLWDLLIAAHHPGIREIEVGGMMTVHLNHSIRRINVHSVHQGEIMNVPYKGKDVIIGVVDTGIDFFHPDFRDTNDQNRSRVLSIWDVRLDPEAHERHPDGFDYGVEYTRDDIERELRGETQRTVRSIDTNGHGTHVAGIAGGNGMQFNGKYTGVAPEAEFIIVAFPDGSFYPAEVVDAMNYIFTRAEQLDRPAVVNLSIGGHFGAHDGTAGHEYAITRFSQRSGNAIAVAAGNSGNDQIHFGQSLSPREEGEFTLRIPSYTPDATGDTDRVLKLLWYESTDIFRVTITSPDGYEVYAESGDSILLHTPDGAVELDTFNNFANQKNARVFLIDIHTNNEGTPPASGDWKISVRNLSGVSGGRFNSWIVSSTMDFPWLIPNTGRQYTVGVPGTAEGAITVGAFVSRRTWTARDGRRFESPGAVNLDLAIFSSGGPTRDGRLKPNISAPGLMIGAPTSQYADYNEPLLLPEEGYHLLAGTSMATPHIAGIAALIFQANPHLTGNEVRGIIENSGATDGYTGVVPNVDWGYGKADAVAMFDHFEITHGIPDEFDLYQNFPNPFNAQTTIRFTIPEATNGRVAVYDILGRKVDTIFSGDFEPRVYSFSFDGSGLSTGIYFYRLETGLFTDVKRMVLLR